MTAPDDTRASSPPPPRAPLLELLQRFNGQPIVVVGDAMLDHFIVGRVQRISPEAPVPVVEHQRDEYRLGGAANVAHNLRALGARPVLVAVTGRDDTATLMRASLADAGLRADMLVEDPARPTTRKVRIVTDRHQQVARVDYESDAEADGDIEASLIEYTVRAAADAAVVVVSDYLKGAVTQKLMAALATLRARRDLHVLVDPKMPHLRYYAGASLVTPNHHEAEVATHRRIRSHEDARAAGRALRRLVGCDSVIVTRGEHGLWLADGSRRRDASGDLSVDRVPWLEINFAARAREVADVTGAGDTVIATVAAALAAGGSLREAAELANHAAGVSVGKFGPAAVTRDELRATLDAD